MKFNYSYDLLASLFDNLVTKDDSVTYHKKSRDFPQWTKNVKSEDEKALILFEFYFSYFIGNYNLLDFFYCITVYFNETLLTLLVTWGKIV